MKGSSGAIETSGSARIFKCTVELRKLTYSTFDSSTFQTVNNRPKDKCDERYSIKKKECLEHIQKRMGNALGTLVHAMKGKKLADGKSVERKGRLTQDKMYSFQR